MAKQVHKEFSDSQVKELIECYLKKEIERKHIKEILGFKKARSFIFRTPESLKAECLEAPKRIF